MALQVYGAPIYVRHEIVHNRHVVEDLRRKGAVFVDELRDVPAGAVVIFSAHGVSPAVRREADERGLKSLDATCPLVTKVHLEALRYAQQGYTILLVGHRQHVEVIGTLGEAPDAIVVVENARGGARRSRSRIPSASPTSPRRRCRWTTCATIVDVLRARFPAIHEPAKDDICYATQNRQNAVKALAARVPHDARRRRSDEQQRQPAGRGGRRASARARPDRVGRGHPARVDRRATWGSPPARRRRSRSCRRASIACAHWASYHVEEIVLVEERIMFPLPGELLAVAQRARRRGAAGQRARRRARRRRIPHPPPLSRAPATPAIGTTMLISHTLLVPHLPTLMIDDQRGHHAGMVGALRTASERLFERDARRAGGDECALGHAGSVHGGRGGAARSAGGVRRLQRGRPLPRARPTGAGQGAGRRRGRAPGCASRRSRGAWTPASPCRCTSWCRRAICRWCRCRSSTRRRKSAGAGGSPSARRWRRGPSAWRSSSADC